MTAKGHTMLSLVLASPLVINDGSIMNIQIIDIQNNTLVFFSMLILGSLLPDIDEPNSYIGRKIKVVSYLIKMLGVRHRTLTHFIILPVGLLLSSVCFFHGYIYSVFVSLSIGIFFHTIGDLISGNGISGYFFPFFKNTNIVLLPKYLRLDVFGLPEKIIILGLTVLNIFVYKEYFLS